MTDYKELIADLRHFFYDEEIVLNAADAIEQLVKERDSAIADLKHDGICRCCKKNNICDGLSHRYCGGIEWEWRGVPDERY